MNEQTYTLAQIKEAALKAVEQDTVYNQLESNAFSARLEIALAKFHCPFVHTPKGIAFEVWESHPQDRLIRISDGKGEFFDDGFLNGDNVSNWTNWRLAGINRKFCLDHDWTHAYVWSSGSTTCAQEKPRWRLGESATGYDDHLLYIEDLTKTYIPDVDG